MDTTRQEPSISSALGQVAHAGATTLTLLQRARMLLYAQVCVSKAVESLPQSRKKARRFSVRRGPLSFAQVAARFSHLALRHPR